MRALCVGCIYQPTAESECGKEKEVAKGNPLDFFDLTGAKTSLLFEKLKKAEKNFATSSFLPRIRAGHTLRGRK